MEILEIMKGIYSNNYKIKSFENIYDVSISNPNYKENYRCGCQSFIFKRNGNGKCKHIKFVEEINNMVNKELLEVEK